MMLIVLILPFRYVYGFNKEASFVIGFPDEYNVSQQTHLTNPKMHDTDIP